MRCFLRRSAIRAFLTTCHVSRYLFRKESPLYGRSYQYEKLTHVKSSIRLIRIQPGSCSNPLVCGLEITDLHNDSTSYEAFSYAWGDATTKVHIECDGGDLWITRNLRDALSRSALMIVSGSYGPTLSALTKMISKNEATKLASCVGFTEERKRSLWLGEDANQDAILAFSLVCIFINANGLHPSSPASFTNSFIR